MSIRIGILGYGNLGKGVESAIGQNPDLELTAVFTRRNPENVKVRTAGVKVLASEELEHMQDQIDVLVLCGGSATDLPAQTPKYAADYNVVDSFDTHARMQRFQSISQQSMSPHRNPERLASSPLAGIRVCSP